MRELPQLKTISLNPGVAKHANQKPKEGRYLHKVSNNNQKYKQTKLNCF